MTTPQDVVCEAESTKVDTMTEKSSVFEQIYRDYLDQVGRLDLATTAESLGIVADGSSALIPLFGKPYSVSKDGISDPHGKQPIHSISVVLCKYLLLCPKRAPDDQDWVSFRDFKDSAPFVGGFVNNVERTIARDFSGRLNELETACKGLGGRPVEMGLSYQVAMSFVALPKVPLFLLFNDADEEFPSQCSVLFERRAESYLDMECLAILGWLLSDNLNRASGMVRETVM
jgi:hypothetical protein